MSDVHESLTDWRTLPVNILAGHRAIVQLDEGTISDISPTPYDCKPIENTEE